MSSYAPRPQPQKPPPATISGGLWSIRLELTIGIGCFLLAWYGRTWIAILMLALLIGPPPLRKVTWMPRRWWPRQAATHLLHAARVRREWRACARKVGIHTPPTLNHIREWPTGTKANIRFNIGCTAADVEKASQRLSVKMQLADVRVKPGETQDRGELVLVRRDPFKDYIKGEDGKLTIRPLAWPDRSAPETSMWEPIRIGIDQDGTEVTLSLLASNVLAGGVPGSGKSGFEAVIVSHAALDPNARQWLMDGKGVDLPVWKPVAYRYCGPDRKEAIALLTELRDETEARFEMLNQESARTGKPVRKISRAMNLPIHVLVCDELAGYLLADDKPGKADADKILELLRQIASKGRAGGVIMVLATQRPDAATIDTRLRTLLTYRAAFRVMDWQSSDTITGGLAKAGYDASEIPEPQKGVCWLCGETGTPVLTRVYWVSDDDIYGIAGRATKHGVVEEPEPEE
jgi:S-DNA-T family DNA segregation ATPase FtsK/SpoIIIE